MPLFLSQLYIAICCQTHISNVIPIRFQSPTALRVKRLDNKTSLVEQYLYHWLINTKGMFHITICSDFLAICTVRMRKSLRIIENV